MMTNEFSVTNVSAGHNWKEATKTAIKKGQLYCFKFCSLNRRKIF